MGGESAEGFQERCLSIGRLSGMEAGLVDGVEVLLEQRERLVVPKRFVPFGLEKGRVD